MADVKKNFGEGTTKEGKHCVELKEVNMELCPGGFETGPSCEEAL